MAPFLLFLLIFSTVMDGSDQQSAGCSSSDLSQVKSGLESKTPKVISVIAGRNTTLECDAFADLVWGDYCDGVTVEWMVIYENGKEEVLKSISTRNYPQSIATNGMTTHQGCDGNESRYCFHDNNLMINYAQANIDDRRLFLCKVTSSPRPPSAAEKALSVYKLQIEKCSSLGEKKKGIGYRGGPCHYGKCFLRKNPGFTFKHNGTNRTALYLTCVCLPGFIGEFCKDPKHDMKKWLKNFAPYFWMFISWLPIILAVVAAVIGVLIYGNGRTELIFKEGELLSPYVRVGGTLHQSPSPVSKRAAPSLKKK